MKVVTNLVFFSTLKCGGKFEEVFSLLCQGSESSTGQLEFGPRMAEGRSLGRHVCLTDTWLSQEGTTSNFQP